MRYEIGRAYDIYEGHERCFRGLVWRPVRLSPIEGPKRRWGDNNKMNTQEVEWGPWS
jgi:hypothetical protein